MRNLLVLPKNLVLSIIFTASVCLANNKEKEATALITRAKLLSDIRADGGPALLLKVNFKIIRDAGTVEGVYTENWVSSSVWRREIIAGEFHSTEVTNDRKRWVLNSTAEMPKEIATAASLIGFHLERISAGFSKPTKIEDRANSSWSLRCVVGEQDDFGGRPEVCFDKSTGELVAWSFPFISTGREINSTCLYANFQKFGDKLFPASIRCTEDGKQALNGTVSELSVPASTDMAFFDSLPGGQEFSNCPAGLKQPQILERPVDNRVAGGPVVLSMTVGTDGKPHGLKVFTSAGKAIDDAAIDAVRQWRFKPATCNGESIEVPIDVAYSVPR